MLSGNVKKKFATSVGQTNIGRKVKFPCNAQYLYQMVLMLEFGSLKMAKTIFFMLSVSQFTVHLHFLYNGVPLSGFFFNLKDYEGYYLWQVMQITQREGFDIIYSYLITRIIVGGEKLTKIFLKERSSEMDAIQQNLAFKLGNDMW